MKAPRALAPFLLVCAAALILMGGCRRPGEGYLEPLTRMESGGTPTSATIESLKRSIEANRAEVERKVKAAQDLGVQLKMLAIKYIDNGMYGLALQTLDSAIEIYPENPILFYYAGISAARLAKAEVADRGRMSLLYSRAEASYQRAISLDPVYVNALYGLAVLYAFELERPADAVALLERILAKEKKNFDALFILARVKYGTGRLDEAIGVYDRILALKPSAAQEKQAKTNRDRIRQELYERK